MHGGAGGVTEGFAAQLGTVTVTNEALEVTYNDSIRSKANYAFVVMWVPGAFRSDRGCTNLSYL